MKVPDHIVPPDGVEFRVSEMDPTQMGAWSTKCIPSGTFMGPYVGDIVRDADEEAISFRFAWEIFNLENGEYLYTINATDPAHANWMRYVNCACYLEEQNLVSVQKDMEMFYKAIKDIEPGEELLTWYQPFKKRRKKKMRSPLKNRVETVITTTEELDDVSQNTEETDQQTSNNGVILGKRQRVKKKMFDDIILMSDLIPKRRRRSKAEIQSEREAAEFNNDKSNDVVPKKRRRSSVKSLDETTKGNSPKISENENTQSQNSDKKIKGKKFLTENENTAANGNIVKNNSTEGSSEQPKQGKCDVLVSKPKTAEEIKEIAEIEATWEYPKPGQEYQFEHMSHFGITKNGRRFFRCDVCSGIYRHTFSLKRHYLRNHINCCYLSKADLANCLVTPAQQWLDIKHANEESMIIRCKTKLASGTPLSEKFDESEVTSPGLYRCCICNKLFDHLKSLTEHTQNHPATPHQKFFGCDQCKMRFTFHQNLLRHKLVHEDGKKKIKKKREKGPSASVGHFNQNDIHGKPYKCSLCPLKFRYQSNLEKHHKIHTADRPFDCSVCGKTFPNETNLKKHMVIHVGSSVHCKYCIETFSHVGTLRKHIRLQHPIIHKERLLNLLTNRGQGQTDQANKLRKSLKLLKKGEKDKKSEYLEKPLTDIKVKEKRIENSDNESEQQVQGNSRFKFACIICKKRFSAYVNMCRHRRMAHKDYKETLANVDEKNLQGQGSQKEEKNKSVGVVISRNEKSIFRPKEKVKVEENEIEETPESVQEFYANVAANIADNLNSYLDGGINALDNYKSYITIDDSDEESEEKRDDTSEKNRLEWEQYNFPSNYNAKLIEENFQLIEKNYDDEVQKGHEKLDRTVFEDLAPALCTRRRSSSEWVAYAEFSKNDSNHGESPLVRDTSKSVENNNSNDSIEKQKLDVEKTETNSELEHEKKSSDSTENIKKDIDSKNNYISVDLLETEKDEKERRSRSGSADKERGTNKNNGQDLNLFLHGNSNSERTEKEVHVNDKEEKLHLHSKNDSLVKSVNNDTSLNFKDPCQEEETKANISKMELSPFAKQMHGNGKEISEKLAIQLLPMNPVRFCPKPGDAIKHADLFLLDLQNKGQIIQNTSNFGIISNKIENLGKIVGSHNIDSDETFKKLEIEGEKVEIMAINNQATTNLQLDENCKNPSMHGKNGMVLKECSSDIKNPVILKTNSLLLMQNDKSTENKIEIGEIDGQDNITKGLLNVSDTKTDGKTDSKVLSEGVNSANCKSNEKNCDMVSDVKIVDGVTKLHSELINNCQMDVSQYKLDASELMQKLAKEVQKTETKLQNCESGNCTVEMDDSDRNFRCNDEKRCSVESTETVVGGVISPPLESDEKNDVDFDNERKNENIQVQKAEYDNHRDDKKENFSKGEISSEVVENHCNKNTSQKDGVQNNEISKIENKVASGSENKKICLKGEGDSAISETSGVMSIDLFTDSDNESDIFTGLALSKKNSEHSSEDSKLFDTDKGEYTEHSPFHNYKEIEFGKNGTVFHICSVCKRPFEDLDRLLRHQWKKHPSIHCHYLQVEQGHEIEYLYYSEPCNRGILGVTGKALESVTDRGSYTCTRCAGAFKSVDRLRIHIINCAPKVESPEVADIKPKYRKRYKKHQKIMIKSEPNSPVKVKTKRESVSSTSSNTVPESPTKTRKLSNQSTKSLKETIIAKKLEDFSLQTARRKKSSEMVYNPHNHIRRRELTELLDTHQCKGCGVKFKSISLLERHVKKCDGKDKFKDLKVMKSNVNDTFHQKLKHSCLYCNRGFSYPKTLMNHYKAFCLVKKEKVSKGQLTKHDKQQESAVMKKLKQQEEDRCFTDVPEENLSGKKGWPRGMKRKWRRKNHCWTYIKKRKPPTEEKTVTEAVDVDNKEIKQDNCSEELTVSGVKKQVPKKDKQNVESADKEISDKKLKHDNSSVNNLQGGIEVRQKRKYVRKKVFSSDENKKAKKFMKSANDSMQSIIDSVSKCKHLGRPPLFGRKTIKKGKFMTKNKKSIIAKKLHGEEPKKRKQKLNLANNKKSDVGSAKKKSSVAIGISKSSENVGNCVGITKSSEKLDNCVTTQKSHDKKDNNKTKGLFNPMKKIRIIRRNIVAELNQDNMPKPNSGNFMERKKPGPKPRAVREKLDFMKYVDSALEKFKLDSGLPIGGGKSDEEVQTSLTKPQRMKIKKNLIEIKSKLLLESGELRLKIQNFKSASKVQKGGKTMTVEGRKVTDDQSNQLNNNSLEKAAIKNVDNGDKQAVNEKPSVELQRQLSCEKISKKDSQNNKKLTPKKKCDTLKKKGTQITVSPEKNDLPSKSKTTDTDHTEDDSKNSTTSPAKMIVLNKKDSVGIKKRIPIYNQDMPKLTNSPSKKSKELAKIIVLKPVDGTMKKKLELTGQYQSKTNENGDVKKIQEKNTGTKVTGNQSASDS